MYVCVCMCACVCLCASVCMSLGVCVCACVCLCEGHSESVYIMCARECGARGAQIVRDAPPALYAHVTGTFEHCTPRIAPPSLLQTPFQLFPEILV